MVARAKLKILHTVEFYHPSRGGAQQVVKRISELLVRRGHEVTVATTRLPERRETVINGVRIAEFGISGNSTRGFRGDTLEYFKLLRSGGFDVMMNYAAQQWATDLALPILDQIPYRKVLSPCGFSGLFWPEYGPYFRMLPERLRLYDHLIFHSRTYRDIQLAQQHCLSHFSVIPNGAAYEEFGTPDMTFRERYGIPRDRPLLLTVGSHTFLKGHELCMRALRKARIGPATLVVIGNTFGSLGCLPQCQRLARNVRWTTLGRKQVLLLDPPREDVVAAYHAADLFLFGSNIECSPIVLFEAMASRTPFISSACGNADEIATWSGSGTIIPTRQATNGLATSTAMDMATAIERLLADPSECERQAEAGYRAWRRDFTWETIAEQYERVYLNPQNAQSPAPDPHQRGTD
jgi:glycosyltransferase involved in cell wall biosynthesis